jgi:hypothetical protein
MTDNIEILHDIQRKIDTSISIFNLPLPFSLPGGHDQTTFNRQSPKLKQDAFYHFLAELYILQKSSRILCTFSSNVGRFLYMTCDNPSGVVSLDISEFTILQDMSIFLENAKRQSR